MAVRHLEAEVRQEPGGAVLDLRGEINGFAEEALDAAYAEAESERPGDHRPELRGGRVHQLDRHSPDRGPAGQRRAPPSAGCSPAASRDHYVEIFDITRLSDFMSVFPDEESAMSETSVS